MYEPGGALRDNLYTITTGDITSGVATITLDLPHEFKIGDNVVILNVTGANAADYNGTRTITATSLYSFSYTVAASDSTISDGNAHDAGYGLELTATGSSVQLSSWDGATNSQLMSIYYPQTSYTFSVYAIAATASEDVSVQISWYDSSGTLISADEGDPFSVTTSDWARPYVTATAPSTAAYASVELLWDTTSGNVLNISKSLFEEVGLVLEYFDGTSGTHSSAGPGTYYDTMWEGGTINGARSHLYNNRYSIQTRLITKVLQEQLPLGSTAAFYIAQPQT